MKMRGARDEIELCVKNAKNQKNNELFGKVGFALEFTQEYEEIGIYMKIGKNRQ